MTGPVQYMERTRAYYQAQGYARSYVWADHDGIPFALPGKPLAQSRMVLITTAMPIEEQQQPKTVQSGPSAHPPERLYNDDLAWDKEATHTRDLDSYFPIHHLADLVREGRLGALAERYHCVPTEYSQRRTLAVDAPEVLSRCVADQADIALLVPL